MKSVIYDLIERVQSEDERIASNAITDLSFLLEMHSWNLSDEDRIEKYDSLTSREVIATKFEKGDEIEIMNFLKKEISNDNKFKAGLLFAIGQSSAKAGIPSLLEVLNDHSTEFSENEFYQAIVALEKLLFFDESMSFDEKSAIVMSTNLLKLIAQKILSLHPISRIDLKSTSLRLLASLILLEDDN